MTNLLPDGFVVFSRDDLVQRYLRSYRARAPGIDTREGTQPWIDAHVMADQQLPIYGNCKRVADSIDLEHASFDALQAKARDLGLVPLLEAIGASGFVTITTSTGGGQIFAGDTLREPNSGLRLRCLLTGLYTSDTPVAVGALDTGPSTNLKAGTTLQWSSARPGIAPTCIVAEQTDGSGLSGGRNEETRSELADRIRAHKANPPASGNDADYQRCVENVRGVAVQKCFTYPAIIGPATVAVAFTVRPSRAGGSRIPSSLHRSTVEQALVGRFPASDDIFVSAISASDVTLVLRVTWSAMSAGWIDAAPWPAYSASSRVHVTNGTTPTATSFTLASTDGGIVNPQAGQTIAFYDAPFGVFRRKRIGTVTGAASPWLIACDTTNNASDTTFTPAVDDCCSPWADALDSLVGPIAAHFDELGPGEQVATPFDAGRRERRQPQSPGAWPSVLTARVLRGLYALDTIDDISIASPSLPYACPTGSAGALSYLLSLAAIVAFP